MSIFFVIRVCLGFVTSLRVIFDDSSRSNNDLNENAGAYLDGIAEPVRDADAVASDADAGREAGMKLADADAGREAGMKLADAEAGREAGMKLAEAPVAATCGWAAGFRIVQFILEVSAASSGSGSAVAPHN